MVGFELKRGVLTIAPETWGFAPFKKLLDRDKSDDKDQATMELLFIHNYCSVGSDYFFLKDKEERKEALKKDLGFPANWEIDKDIQAAIDFYEVRSRTVLTDLYESTVASVAAITDYLSDTATLLKERDKYGKTITKLSDITSALKSVKVIMKDVEDTYRNAVKEAKEITDRNIGKQQFNTFEEGLEYE